jgi:hypothetical protein
LRCKRWGGQARENGCREKGFFHVIAPQPVFMKQRTAFAALPQNPFYRRLKTKRFRFGDVSMTGADS